MARTARLVADDGFYHLIARGNNKRPVFEIGEGYSHFKELLLSSKEKFDWQIFHYCLMPNHLHVLARVRMGQELPRLMKYLLQSYSKWYRSRIEYSGYLWQGRYKSPLIENESYLLQCGRYIERNPVRAGLSSLEGYPWSSYRYYAFGDKDALISEDPSYSMFGHDPLERQKNYRDFVAVDVLHEAILDEALVSRYF